MLSGTTVVDFTRHLPGLYCTMRLADMGAEVIKIEAYPPGEAGRTGGPRVDNTGLCYPSTNRNKRSVALNLRTAAGRELAFALAAQADVVVESFRPGVMSHLGLDYEALVEAKPDLIYCSLTGYGQSGTMYQLGGHDLNYQAVSGFSAANRDSEGRPVIPEVPLADFAGGLYAAEQICAALVQKERTGRGVFLDVASVDVMASWTALHMLLLGHTRQEATIGQYLFGLINYNVYETSDGRFVALAALEEKFWHNFCHAVGREDWEPYIGRSVLDQSDVYEEMKALFLTRTQTEWNDLGMEVDCCLTAVEEIDTWLASPYVTSRLSPFVVRHALETHGAPAKLQEATEPVPPTGGDTYDVLRSRLSVNDGQLQRYAMLGIIPKGVMNDESTDDRYRTD
ncbi:CoA transferase [Brevibacillus humidisoli]|uniref:CaiB/BaiF CoA transferase family protein n=1 Tax=Brevibacillus humidisoli TaxID=2895522 RepID=UPI001E5040DD|nr:CoA transferase [Brevibacillus humidisoli]UFJ41976.1 CoA transferase [Brevibacillus humidisoli]